MVSEHLANDYLEKLLLLEGRVGSRVGYQMFEPPSDFDSADLLALNRIARVIADSVGVKDRLTVTPTVHPKDCAGHIDLGDTAEGVFIEVAEDLLEFPDCVLATLAHEISHRYLHLHGVSCGTGPAFHYHNEILTDITAVFLGLGKLMLNGCTGQREFRSTSGVVTHTRTVGYLDRQQLTFVYLLVCEMRNILTEEYEEGLLPIAVDGIRQCRNQYSLRFFSANFRGDGFLEELQIKLDRTKSDVSTTLNLLEQKLYEINEGYLSRVLDFLGKARTQVASSDPHSQPISYDPALKFLLAVRLNLEISKAIADLNCRIGEAEQHTNLLCELVAVADGKARAKFRPMDRWKNWLRHKSTKAKSRS
jgi:hypothetical protein